MLWALLLLAMIRHRSRRQSSYLDARLAGALRFAVMDGALSPHQAVEYRAQAASVPAETQPDALVQ